MRSLVRCGLRLAPDLAPLPSDERVRRRATWRGNPYDDFLTTTFVKIHDVPR